jgi:hypothetical protein
LIVHAERPSHCSSHESATHVVGRDQAKPSPRSVCALARASALLEVLEHLREVVPDLARHRGDLPRRQVPRHRVERRCVLAALAVEGMTVDACLGLEELLALHRIPDSRYRQVRSSYVAGWKRRLRGRQTCLGRGGLAHLMPDEPPR